ncbi:hypothetical protein K491DRAFT_167900 [Lophiostoma macrostomum CBS 122681]|uniref:DUF6536 domain-containing protein n=1 Tax=Lophiostoma macrostomum CBS 122681 TaxID=1314788 RepID=A0A6A6SQ76_9PLEO|nr:hypothetical protein K491DRAFT_167900 [Lophiostoma macrostomum CBS 122681]
MAKIFNHFNDSFSGKKQSNTQESISLRVLSRLRGEHPAAPDAGTTDSDNLERGARLERSEHSLASLYSLLRFVKIVGLAWNNLFPGWRGGIAGFTILASIVLILNISALIWTATHLDDGNYATLTVGSYKSISNLSGRIHFGMNILSMALLAGSNYCMQCLSSPTRAEVDAAHARGSYVNIGALSWRNVLTSRKRRICLLSLLTLSSIVMHPVYDTSLLMTTALQKYTSTLVTSDYKIWSQVDYDQLQHEPAFRVSHANGLADRLRYIQDIIATDQIWDSSLWDNISASDCVKYKTLQTDRSTLLIVLNGTPEQIYLNQDARLAPYRSIDYTNLLQGYLRYDLYPAYPAREKGWASTSKWQSRISYCLSRKVPGRCRLQIHLWLLLAATLLNAMKLGCLLLTLKEQQETPLITTGDAIASFLRSPCLHTAGKSLLTQEEIVRELKERQDNTEDDATSTMKRFETRPVRYHHAISASRWMVYISSFVLILAFAVYQYHGISNLFRDTNPDFDLRSSWKAGLGNLDDNSLTDMTFCDFGLPTPIKQSSQESEKWLKCRITYGGVSAMVIANLPQLSVSAMYLSFNHQLTLMVQLRDWASLASRRQALRVSNPEPASDQVSTYWLSLPYLYSIPLLLAGVLLGWLVSQTLFIVRYALFDELSADDVPDVGYTMGYSAIALVCLFIFGLVILGVSVAVGCCKCSPGMPLGPSNSLVIAAACHPPETDRYAARNMVRWGAVPTGNITEEASMKENCTITSRRVEYPIEGRWYG